MLKVHRFAVNSDELKNTADSSNDPQGPLPLDVECPRCKAKVGISCVSHSIRGTWAAKTHAVRWKAVGVDQPTYEDRARDYRDFKKRQQDRILAEHNRRRALR